MRGDMPITIAVQSTFARCIWGTIGKAASVRPREFDRSDRLLPEFFEGCHHHPRTMTYGASPDGGSTHFTDFTVKPGSSTFQWTVSPTRGTAAR